MRARPLFRGHDQPHLPADLGFYDLRVPEARVRQAELAASHGIDGFCYYHYWFHGRRLLERPFEEVLRSGCPDFPFALCWANESWTRSWDGRLGEHLVRQEYSEADDWEHGRWLAEVFADPRYIRVDDKPLFLVYRASEIPDPQRTTDIWREASASAGIGDIFLGRVESGGPERTDPRPLGFDAAVEFQPDWSNLGTRLLGSPASRMASKVGLATDAFRRHRVYDYCRVVERMLQKPRPLYRRFPCVTPRWDNSPRRAVDATILAHSSPEAYGAWLRQVLERELLEPGPRLVFVNAWNEWAEGNHLEPCDRWGRAYLEATRQAMTAAGTMSSH